MNGVVYMCCVIFGLYEASLSPSCQLYKDNRNFAVVDLLNKKLITLTAQSEYQTDALYHFKTVKSWQTKIRSTLLC